MATKKKATKPATKRKAPAAKRAPAKKPVAKKAVVKRVSTPVKKPYTKSQVATEIAELVGVTRKQVSDVFSELAHVVERHVKNGGAGSFSLPGLLKITTVKKKATKARKGVNPFTGEACTFKAKPARTVVKVRALKGLKDMV